MIIDEIKKDNVQAMKDKNTLARAIYGVVMNKVLLAGIEAKKDGKFMSIDDLKIRSKIGKSVIEMLERVGCLKGMSQSNQMSLFG